ncbi:Bax inhibitor-1/YccA family protein [Streptomyces sp. NPDC048643]|uniref:Bax inhibitor-1/YccA family protein n=1 Tax=Streptomyces sp. NPDC048643 TaxID=3155637 RepID=UPI003425B49E
MSEMKSWNPLLKPREQALGSGNSPLDLQERSPDTVDARLNSTGYSGSIDFTKRAPHDTTASAVTNDLMTIDDVVMRTALTLGMVVLGAVLAWTALPVDEENLGPSYAIAFGAALVATVVALIQAFRSNPSPALILSYAALEGVFLGVISNTVSTYIEPGVVVQTVIGTMAVFAGVLIAYRLRWIRVTGRFYNFVVSATLGFVILAITNLLFAAFGGGDGLGFRSGWLGVLFGLAGLLLGAAFLAIDFKQAEEGVAAGAPREQSWLSAFGLTLSLVWIYLEILQLLTLLGGDDLI